MPEFTVISKMNQKDYRKFLNIATFRRSPKVMLVIDAIALVAAGLFSFDGQGGSFSFQRFVVLFALFFAAAVLAVSLLTGTQIKNRMKQKGDDEFEESIFNFYPDKFGMKTTDMKSQKKIDYDSIYSVMDSRDFFIFFITDKQAIPLNKSSVEDAEALGAFLKGKMGKRYIKA